MNSKQSDSTKTEKRSTLTFASVMFAAGLAFRIEDSVPIPHGNTHLPIALIFFGIAACRIFSARRTTSKSQFS